MSGSRFSVQRPPRWLAYSLASLALAVCILSGMQRAAANAVTGWNQELLVLIQQSSINLVDGPPEVAREMAIVTSSMHDAVNAASGLVNPSYAYTGPAVTGVSADAAALAAGYRAVTGIFTDTAWQSPTGQAAANKVLSLATQYYTSGLSGLGLAQATPSLPDLSGCANPGGALAAVCGGLNLGVTAAGAVLAKQANDGSQTAILHGLTAYMPPGSGTVPGVYIPPSATGGRVAMFPEWGSVTPTGLSPAGVSALVATYVPGPPAIGSAAYAASVLKTECLGHAQALPASVMTACAAGGFAAPRTAAQARSALFWNDPGGTIQPPGHWLQITNSLIQSQGLDLLQSARVSMLLSQAENDAGIAAWQAKYIYNLWRPGNAIRSCASGVTGGVSWNPAFTSCDGTWASLIATPPHPDYVAGHPAFSGAAVSILDAFFGTDAIPFTSISQSYCNGGTGWTGTAGTIVACTVNPASGFAYNGANTIFSTSGLDFSTVCQDIGGVFDMVATTCALDGTTYAWSSFHSGCDSVVNDGVTNDSPLICAITESFASLSEAASGPDGSVVSRIYGGIHTDFSVDDALALGLAIGRDLAAENGIPAPGSGAIFCLALLGLVFLHTPATASGRFSRVARSTIRLTRNG